MNSTETNSGANGTSGAGSNSTAVSNTTAVQAIQSNATQEIEYHRRRSQEIAEAVLDLNWDREKAYFYVRPMCNPFHAER